MKTRFILYRRGSTYYCEDSVTRKQESLRTKDQDAAEQVVLAKNQALRQPTLNLHIAKAYLAGSDSGVATRTWQQALDSLIETKLGSTQERWRRAARDRALSALRPLVIIETQAEHLLVALKQGSVSTNVHLRKLHNFCLAMGWLPWPILPKRQWPPVKFTEKRAIAADEHARIVEREQNPERRAFYELCWLLGGSQHDIANLTAEDVCLRDRVISYFRQKTKSVALVSFGQQVEEVLNALPASGPLFPHLQKVRSGDRATEFKQRCRGLGIDGVTLHSYRYAWAERAKICGYPERFAQEALGHNSKAVHRAYAKKAKVLVPSLEEFEAHRTPVIDFPRPRRGVVNSATTEVSSLASQSPKRG